MPESIFLDNYIYMYIIIIINEITYQLQEDMNTHSSLTNSVKLYIIYIYI